MEVIAKARNIRMSARKVRLVAGLIRGMKAPQALSTLRFVTKAASAPVTKLVESAMANAEHNFHLNKELLTIKTITVDGGMPLKRWRARAMGRAAPILKHSCHINVVLEGTEKIGARAPKKEEKAKADKKTESVTTELPKDEKVTEDLKHGHKEEPVDVKRLGKHRNVQHQDGKQMKEKKGE